MYILRRLLYLPFSLILLSLTCFALRSFVPGDPVADSLPTSDMRIASKDPAEFDRVYRRAAASLGYDIPAFYLSIRNAALPDTLDRIARPEEKAMLRALTLDTGNWGKVATYYSVLRASAFGNPAETGLSGLALARVRRLLIQDDPQRIRSIILELISERQALGLTGAYQNMYDAVDRTSLLGLRLSWHGTDNQYHQWLTNLLAGDAGVSYIDHRPVADKLKEAVPWTVLLNFLTLIVILLASIPLGLYLTRRADTRRGRLIASGLFFLYGIPSFWAATLLATFLTTPAYGLELFPSIGFGKLGDDPGLWETVRIRGAHLFLPVMCLSYPGWAYFTRHLLQSGLAEMNKGYVRTAKMLGVSERRILWSEVLRNASFPLVTLLGTIFPEMLVGSILIERIFNLPGMGQLLFQSATDGDWPVVILLVMINGVLTAISLLIADLAYSFLDPRVQLNRSVINRPTAS